MKHFVPTPSEGRESEGEPFTFFKWILRVPGGELKLHFQQQEQKLAYSHKWNNFWACITNWQKHIKKNNRNTWINIAVHSLICVIIYSFIFASNCCVLLHSILEIKYAQTIASKKLLFLLGIIIIIFVGIIFLQSVLKACVKSASSATSEKQRLLFVNYLCPWSRSYRW